LYTKLLPSIRKVSKFDEKVLKNVIFSIDGIAYSFSDLKDVRFETENVALAQFTFKQNRKNTLNSIKFNYDGPFLARWISLKPENAKEEFAIVTQKEPNFKKINPTLYEISINPNDGRWVIFNESFHPLWSLYWGGFKGAQSILSAWFNSKHKIPDKYHFVVNGYANAWYIPPSGKELQDTIQLILRYEPQILLLLGLSVSFITFICIVVNYIVQRLKKRKNT
jgi:hypothetical protein